MAASDNELPNPGDIVDGYIYVGRAKNRGDAKDSSKWYAQARDPGQPGQPMVTLPTTQQSMGQEVASRNPLEVFNAGIGSATDVPAMKLKSQFTSLQPDDQARMEAARSELQTIPGILGNAFGGTIGTGKIFGNVGRAEAIGPLGRVGTTGGLSSLQAGAMAPDNAKDAMLYGGLLGLGAGGLGEGLNAAIAARNARAVPNLSGPELNRLAVAKDARDFNLKINPLETNPGPLTQAAGMGLGRQAAAQGMSLENIRPVVAATAKDIGLTEKTLTPNAVAKVIEKAGEKYDALRATGTFSPDDTFIRSLLQIGQENGGRNSRLTSLQNPEVQQLIKEGVDLGTKEPQTATEILKDIKDLRFRANRNYASTDPAKVELARAQKAMANSYEDLMERQLAARGDFKTLAQFRAARTTIARASLLQDAMDAGGGSVPSAKYLGARLRAGEPIPQGSGTRAVAEAANEFSRDFQDLRNIADVPPATRLDAFGSAAAVGAGMPYLAAAIPTSKIGLNRLLASNFGQNVLGRPPTGLMPQANYGLATPALLSGVPLLNQ